MYTRRVNRYILLIRLHVEFLDLAEIFVYVEKKEDELKFYCVITCIIFLFVHLVYKKRFLMVTRSIYILIFNGCLLYNSTVCYNTVTYFITIFVILNILP
jgi:hypothetical protein